MEFPENLITSLEPSTVLGSDVGKKCQKSTQSEKLEDATIGLDDSSLFVLEGRLFRFNSS